jgi:hypothetical protein
MTAIITAAAAMRNAKFHERLRDIGIAGSLGEDRNAASRSVRPHAASSRQ